MANIKFTTVTDATRSAGTPADGEYVWTSDTKKFYRGDSSSSGGNIIGPNNAFATVSVSGQSDVVADSPSDTLTLVAGSNVTITTNATSDSVTISAAAAGGSGDVTKVGTPANNQVGVWTGDGTLEGDTALTFDTANDALYVAGQIELGHASDTTLTRASAGVVSIEGVNVVTVSATQTLTNKTLTSPSLTTPALGTPTSGTLTSCTGLPVSTGISGLGANVATALGINVGTAGAPVVNGGALGTPTSGTLTNCTGLPTAGIVDSNVTNAKLANMAASTIKGRVTASTGVPEDLTAAQARAIVEAAAPDTVTITGSTTLTKAAHQGKVLYCTTGALNLTVNNSTDFDAYASCEIVNKTGAVVTIVATATINRIGSKPLTLPANGRATLMREATADVYLLTGEMA